MQDRQEIKIDSNLIKIIENGNTADNKINYKNRKAKMIKILLPTDFSKASLSIKKKTSNFSSGISGKLRRGAALKYQKEKQEIYYIL